MSTLAQLIDRVEVALLDATNVHFSVDTITQGLRQALREYSLVRPQEGETVLVLPAAGREIALDSITGLLEVTDVWWPYDTLATSEVWPPNRVRGWRVWWDDAQPVLFLTRYDGEQPQADEEVRVWYTKQQTIENLDSGSVTTLPLAHEEVIVNGGAGFAAMTLAVAMINTVNTDVFMVGLMGTWGKTKINEFRKTMESLRAAAVRSGPAWAHGWVIDKWDSIND
jgi:hypothetical protein